MHRLCCYCSLGPPVRSTRAVCHGTPSLSWFSIDCQLPSFDTPGANMLRITNQEPTVAAEEEATVSTGEETVCTRRTRNDLHLMLRLTSALTARNTRASSASAPRQKHAAHFRPSAPRFTSRTNSPGSQLTAMSGANRLNREATRAKGPRCRNVSVASGNEPSCIAMNQPSWAHVKELLHQALALEPDVRAKFLDEVCASNAALRAELESLLSVGDELKTGFLESPPSANFSADDAAFSAAALAEGQLFAERFQLVRRLGEGGMGQVWLAEQTAPVRRPVALKLIKA